MAIEDAKRDNNYVTSMLFVGTDGFVHPAEGDEATGRLLVDNAGGGSGTVTSVSVVSANGFAGTVATATTTPAITLTTTVTGILSGNGTAISAASTTGTGVVVLATAPTFPTSITVGAAAGTTGSILFKGTTSGTVTLKSADAAGTWTLTLPTDDGDSGQVLSTNGSGVTSWVSAGGVPTTITVANEATDTSCFLAFFTAASGDLGPKTNANMTFDSSTGIVTFASSVLTTTDINGGTIDGTIIGGASAAAATITTLIITSFGGNWTNAGRTVADLGIVTTVDINGGTVDGTIIGGASAAAITGTVITANTSVLPDADDGAPLGAAGTAFSDLFLAEGGVINWDSSDATITQTGNVLAVAGADFRIATADVGTNADTVPTLSSTNTLTNKTLTSPTITTATLSGAQQLAEGAGLRLDAALSADGTWSGTTISGTAGATLAFGDLIYLAAADSRWELADADAASTSGDVMLGFCVLAAAADGDPTVILLDGNIRADAAFPALTISAQAYVGTTAGDIQTAQPSGTDDVIRVVGFALTADSLLVKISPDYITHT